MNLIGQTLKRKRKSAGEPDTVNIVGWNGLAYVCESAESFGPVFLLTEADLAGDYGARADPIVDDATGEQRRTIEAHKLTRRSLARNARYTRGTAATPDPQSPEGQFAAAAAATEAADD